MTGWMQQYAINELAKRYNAEVTETEWEGECAYRVENKNGIAIYVDRGNVLKLVSQS